MNNTPLESFLEQRPTVAEALALAGVTDMQKLTQLAGRLRDQGHGNLVSYSRKIFIPLTKLCRDFCHYCTFAQPPSQQRRGFMTPDEVLALVRQGEAAGCKEALFTLGDKPELRYRALTEAICAQEGARLPGDRRKENRQRIESEGVDVAVALLEKFVRSASDAFLWHRLPGVCRRAKPPLHRQAPHEQGKSLAFPHA
jgi:biotin synthase-like enzyme